MWKRLSLTARIVLMFALVISLFSAVSGGVLWTMVRNGQLVGSLVTSQQGNVSEQGTTIVAQGKLVQQQRELLHQREQAALAMAKALAERQLAAQIDREFVELTFWLTEIALSQSADSERKAATTRKRVEVALAALLQVADPQWRLDDLAAAITACEADITAASDAYLGEDRVLGNASFAKAKAKARVIAERLTGIRDALSTVVAAKQEQGRVINEQIVDLGKAITEAGTAMDASRTKVEAGGRSFEKMVADNQRVIRISTLALAICTGVGLLIAGLYSRQLSRLLNQLVARLSACAQEVVSAAGQIANSSQKLAEGNSEAAASLEETSASLEEMTSMVKRNAEAAGKAKAIASETRAAADTGTADMAEMKTAMDEIKTSSADIAKIIKTIDEIAFQTNILALNAAVEAARAGEAGMGFAVVADEVRNLAQRSALSAKETADKIETAIGKSERGVQISAKVAANFNQITSKARAVDQYVGEIATASQEQAQGVSQVNTALTQMDKVTQNNAASAEESASAAEELNGQAETMKDAVGELRQLVGTAGATRPSAARPVTRPVTHGQRHPPSIGNGFRKPASEIPMPSPRNTTPAVASGDFKDF